MAKPAVCSHRNHFQTVSRSKDKAKSRKTSRLDENEVYDDKASEEDEKHTFSLSAKQSWKNKLFFFFNQGARNTSGGRKGLRCMMRSCGIFGAVSRRFLSFPAVLQFFKTKWLSFSYQFGKFRCAICGILLFFRAVLPFSEPPLP